jgi:hypothetical protein
MTRDVKSVAVNVNSVYAYLHAEKSEKNLKLQLKLNSKYDAITVAEITFLRNMISDGE